MKGTPPLLSLEISKNKGRDLVSLVELLASPISLIYKLVIDIGGVYITIESPS
jgi:hypothetical protein